MLNIQKNISPLFEHSRMIYTAHEVQMIHILKLHFLDLLIPLNSLSEMMKIQSIKTCHLSFKGLIVESPTFEELCH